ncbi:hypothetical protein JKP88DRAFT_307830 [Tribonema minus]|uniref:Uncharacterized protein n=1 Tax=Tribonema minus TaxID=303371 RepID=A0A835ZDZ1_9STRA|nr:hypothetical protein JKP88DRAFT_307830 [Tribonema minus]
MRKLPDLESRFPKVQPVTSKYISQLPFILTLSAKCNAGKSYLAVALITLMQREGSITHTWILSPTASSNSIYRNIIGEDHLDRVHDDLSAPAVWNTLKAIQTEMEGITAQYEADLKYAIVHHKFNSGAAVNSVDEQLLESRGYMPCTPRTPSYCVLVDDAQASPLLSRAKANPFLNAILRHRHMARFGVSFVLVSQTVKGLPKAVRTNTTHWAFFKTLNKKEIEECYDEITKVRVNVKTGGGGGGAPVFVPSGGGGQTVVSTPDNSGALLQYLAGMQMPPLPPISAPPGPTQTLVAHQMDQMPPDKWQYNAGTQTAQDAVSSTDMETQTAQDAVSSADMATQTRGPATWGVGTQTRAPATRDWSTQAARAPRTGEAETQTRAPTLRDWSAQAVPSATAAATQAAASTGDTAVQTDDGGFEETKGGETEPQQAMVVVEDNAAGLAPAVQDQLALVVAPLRDEIANLRMGFGDAQGVLRDIAQAHISAQRTFIGQREQVAQVNAVFDRLNREVAQPHTAPPPIFNNQLALLPPGRVTAGPPSPMAEVPAPPAEPEPPAPEPPAPEPPAADDDAPAPAPFMEFNAPPPAPAPARPQRHPARPAMVAPPAADAAEPAYAPGAEPERKKVAQLAPLLKGARIFYRAKKDTAAQMGVLRLQERLKRFGDPVPLDLQQEILDAFKQVQNGVRRDLKGSMASITNSAADANQYYMQQGGFVISTAEIDNRIASKTAPPMPVDNFNTVKRYVSQGYIALGGAVSCSALNVSGVTNLNSTLAVVGAANLTSTLNVTGTLAVTGNLNVNSNLAVTGAATHTGPIVFSNTAGAVGTAAGTRIVLYPVSTPSTNEYSIGVGPNVLWIMANPAAKFSFCSGATEVMAISNTGTITGADLGGLLARYLLPSSQTYLNVSASTRYDVASSTIQALGSNILVEADINYQTSGTGNAGLSFNWQSKKSAVYVASAMSTWGVCSYGPGYTTLSFNAVLPVTTGQIYTLAFVNDKYSIHRDLRKNLVRVLNVYNNSQSTVTGYRPNDLDDPLCPKAVIATARRRMADLYQGKLVDERFNYVLRKGDKVRIDLAALHTNVRQARKVGQYKSSHNASFSPQEYTVDQAREDNTITVEDIPDRVFLRGQCLYVPQVTDRAKFVSTWQGSRDDAGIPQGPEDAFGFRERKRPPQGV